MLSTTAGSLLSLLDEEEPELQFYALGRLNELVDVCWAEISDAIEKIEVLYEDETFKERELAAIVASKVYYHLGELSEAMNYALHAGQLFEIWKKSEFTETLVSKCVEEYISKRVSQEDDKETIDPRLDSVIERLFEKCIQNREYKEALGIALESRREDKIEEIISKSENPEEIMEYCLNVSTKLITSRVFRHNVFRILVNHYQNLSSPDYITVVRIMVFLDDIELTANLILNLLNTDELLSYQIAFDLVSNATQQFRESLRKLLKEKLDDNNPVGPSAMETESSFQSNLTKVLSILTGETTILSYLEFLHQNNKADMGVLKNTKNNQTSSDVRNSVTHSAIIFANAAMNAGTTRDTFLRENLEWLSRATNWAKFSATAGLGVIHKGHLREGKKILNDYLPNKVSSSPYSEGGALYALGLIFANHGEEVTDYMTECLREFPQVIQIQHGAALGLGIAGVATGNNEIYNELKNVLLMDNASAGEAAGIAMGLVQMGTLNNMAMNDMIAAAHDTSHEKIIRGLAVGVSFIVYGREEQADDLIRQLTSDKDPVLRYGGVYCVGLAYCGTSNNSAIRQLLHFAVSDVSDDVRRAAVTCLGFVLSREPEQCPRIVSLLAESYNPHVRYGATLAVGIACAGTGLSEAIDLLLPMASDKIDFVRQGAFIALAMVLIQRTSAQEPRVATVRKLYEDKIADPHELTMAKFGAIMAQGIIDAGGRNCNINIHSISGHKNLLSVVGLTVFTQYWYWYPFTHFISLSFSPTAIIGLNKDLKQPKFSFVSNARPSLFAYPPDIKPPSTAAPSKVAAPVLSTARKMKAKKDAMVIDEEKKEEEKPNDDVKNEEKKKRRKKEPTFELKENPARITVDQLKHISFKDDERFCPIRDNKKGDLFGIVVLRDTKPGLPEDLEEEPSAPAEFELNDD